MTESDKTPDAPSKGAALGLWRPSFFYGWVIVAVVFVAEFAASGMGGHTISLFFKPMNETLGWSLTKLTGAVTAQAIAGIALAPLVGALLDRYGARPVMFFGALSAGIGLILLTTIQEVWQFWLLYAVVGALGLHELGQLTGPVVVAKWFVRRRGRAMALATLGQPMGGMVMAPIIGLLIVTVGWRQTWALMGIALLVVMVPIVLLLVRRQPEDMGLKPDGDPAESEAPSRPLGAPGPPPAKPETTWTLREALHTRTVWVLMVALNLIGLSAGVFTIHMVPY